MADMSRKPEGAGRAVRPRYRRIAAAGAACVVTLVAVLGGVGVISVDGGPQPAYAGTIRTQSGASAQAGALAITGLGSVFAQLPRDLRPPSPEGGAVEQEEKAPAVPGLPARSGHGKRVVFDIGDQRVWLVSARDKVRRTYLVSGSLTDNLGPGRYSVYSKSRHAIGIDDSGTMQYMVRFTQGGNAAIGFHDIPVYRGEKVQTRRQLGTPQSHGCIRQLRPDAKALWAFAPVGTKVVVTD